MTARMKSLGIDRLSREERIELVHEICESLEADDDGDALSDGLRHEIDRRLSAHDANPEAAIAYEVAEAEALSRIRK